MPQTRRGTYRNANAVHAATRYAPETKGSPLYGPLVIAYLFLGGTAAGGFFAMAAWSLAARRKRVESAAGIGTAHIRLRRPSTQTMRLGQAFEALQVRVYTLCLMLLALAILFLFWDLGSPERVLLILLLPNFTVLTFGAICLTIELVLGALLVLGTLFRLRPLQGRGRRVIEALCCIASLATVSYTGVFLVTSPGIPFWHSWALVALFVCSSLSCGLTLMLLVDWFMRDQTLLLRAARPLQKWHLLCLAAEAVFAALFAFSVFDNPDAAAGRAILLSPEVLPAAAVGVLGMGIAAPAALETYALAQQDCRTIPVSDVLCLTGGLILRWAVIVCGAH